MAVASLGLLGSGTGTSAGTTIAVVNTTGAVIPAGTLVHITGGWDNINNVTAPTVTCSTIGGATAIANHATAVGQGVTTTAGVGVWHQCFRAVTTASIASGATIATLTSNQSAVKRAAAAQGWSGALDTLRGTVTTALSAAGAPSVTTTGTALVAGDLVIGSSVVENNAVPGSDTDTLNGSWTTSVGIATSGGSANTNVAVGIQSKTVTATGAQTFQPTGAIDMVACVYSVQPQPEPTITQAAYRLYEDSPETGLVVIDSYSETNGDTSGATTAAGGGAGQSFLGTGRKLTSVGFYLNKSGAPPGGVTAYLYAHTGTFGSGGSPTGSPLATSTTTTLSSLVADPAYQWSYFNFDGTFTLVNGTPYFIVFKIDTGTNISNCLGYRYDNSSPTHAGNGATFDGTTWTAQTRDLMFQVLTSAALAAQNTGVTVDLSSGDANLQVRVLLQSTNASTIPATDDWQLQWEKNTSGTWTNVAPFQVGGLNEGYPSSNANANVLLTDTTGRTGQSFLGNGQRLAQVGFWLNKVGTPTGTISAALYAHSGTFGTNGVGTGTALATSTTSLAATSISTTASMVYFDFDQTVTLTSGTPYVIVATAAGGSPLGNHIAVWTDNTTPTHPGNQSQFGTFWTGDVANDTIFELYTQPATVATTAVAYASANLTDAAVTTNRLTGGTGTFTAGKVSEDGLVDDQGWTGTNYTELLYSVTLKQADLANSDTIRFRVVRNGATTGLTYTQTPTVTVAIGAVTGGASTGAFSFVGSAAGQRTPKGTATGAFSFVGAAAGARTSRGTAAGAVSWVGAATGTAPAAAPPGAGSAAGAITWAGTAAGARMSKGSNTTGAFAFVGTGAGKRTPKAQATGAVSFVGAAAGARTSRGTATTGAVAWAGSAAGARTPKASTTGAFNFVGAAAGKRTPKATATTGAFTFAGTAAGVAPTVGVKQGTATGAYTMVGAAVGKRSPKASATGAVTWVGTASGARTPKAAATGAVSWVGAAVGRRVPTGAATTGAFAFVGTAAGKRVPKATATGAFSFVGSAAGKRTPKASSAGLVTWTGTATGDTPPNRGAATGGTITFVGTGSGARVSKGATTGTLTWAGTAAGKRTPKASGGGAVTWVGNAAGVAPIVGVSQGTSFGHIQWTGAATGARTSRGTATGTVVWSSSGTGKRTPKAAATAAITWVGAGAGKRTAKATALGAVEWRSLAAGATGGLGEARGSATGGVLFFGLAAGQRKAKGTAMTGDINWAAVAEGLRVASAQSTGLVEWAAAAVGAHEPVEPLLIPTIVDAMLPVVTVLEANGIRCVIDYRAMNPPCCYLPPPEIEFRFSKGDFTANYSLILVASNTTRRLALDEMSLMLVDVQRILGDRAVRGEPEDVPSNDGSAVLLGYRLTWADRIRRAPVLAGR